MTWTLDNTLANANRFKAYNRKHPAETASCIRNTMKLLDTLRGGVPFQNAKFGFLRSEGGGLWRVGQTGIPHAKETRLYFCVRGETLSVLCIGGKETQRGDIDMCRKIIAGLEGETK